MVYTAPSNVREAIQRFYRDVNDKIAKLRSIKRRLPLWTEEALMTGVPADVAEKGPIFVGTDRTSRVQRTSHGSSSAPPTVRP
jgi:hypothetical protein